jgi:hypothetical protein
MIAPVMAVAAALSIPAAPRSGLVKAMVPGDLMCYVTLDSQGVRTQVGATFELCERHAEFVGKHVRLRYRSTSVSDCQSAEPCGKSRRVLIVISMRRIVDG